VAAIQWQNARHWEKRYIGAEKAHSATVAAYTGAQIAAKELNNAKVAQIEAERREIAYVKDAEIRSRINAAVADAKRVWAARTAQSFTRHADTSQIATASVDTNGASRMPFMDENDVRICTINTMKAIGWQDYYNDLARE
jgi:aminoglycoside phosphotransferase